ncbi:MAG TPA: lipoyl(octanoyl) transferase LipB [Solirubrobacteraceae bacterium]|nr:lipoyl(octanoyl) transferase LipB [Solirubrobacteraceae bacterium]
MSRSEPRTSPSREMWVCHLGLAAYRDGLAMQQQLRERRQAGAIPDTLLLLEHPPTYTRGRRAGAGELALGESFYRERGIEVHDTDRGGRVTYHAPGQLVGYPILAIDDVGRHLRTMERALVDALAQIGIDAHSRAHDGPDYTGVWVGDPRAGRQRKIASIGVHVARGVTTHGFAVNVSNDLRPFTWVIACGLPDVEMTSVARELAPAAVTPGFRAGDGAGGGRDDGARTAAGACARGERESLACFRKRVAHAFCAAHARRQRLVSPHRLGIDTANAAPRAQRAPINTNSTTEMEPIPA